MKFLWALLLVVGLSSVLADTWNIEEHLATHNPYWSQGSRTPSPAPPTCSLSHVDLVSRHGSRNPTSGDVKGLAELQAQIQTYSQYINKSWTYILNWKSPFVLNQQGFLGFAGEVEMFQMGQRFNSTYYPLFSQQYYPDVYVIQTTQVPRTGESASAFAQGFLQGTGGLGPSNFQPTYIYSNTQAYDYLRFFDNCPVYVQAMDNGTINEDQSEKYLEMNFPAIIARVEQMLGVTGQWNISIDTLDTMFSACSFEVALFNKTDGWCAIFSPSDIDIYEYGSDLSDYWTKSYGSPLGYQIGSVILQDVVATIDAVIQGSLPTQKAYLRFAHAEDIIPLSAVLGLYKESYDLTANLSQELIDNRIWRTSMIAPFSANIAFFLYSCGSDYKIRLTVNEVETPFPGCGENIFCDYNTFKTIYASALSFNFTAACTEPVHTPPVHHITSSELAVGIIVAFAVGGGLTFLGAVIYIRRQQQKYSQLTSLDINS